MIAGMPEHQAVVCRELAVQAALLGYHRRDQIHYTEGPERWQGFTERKIAAHGQFPTEVDCSAFVTWCEAQGLHFRYGLDDVVNGANWTGGYTGTMITHGERVYHESNTIRADAVIYGIGKQATKHTAMIVAHRDSDNKPMVVSMGSEAGPLYLPYDYRSDIDEIHRYIPA